MVEQVTINPTEVRGYGNICEEHSLDDFIVSSSGLAKEKENVHGALTDVYRLVYSLYGLIFSFDKGNKQLYLQTNEANTLSLGFDAVNKQLYLVDVDDTGFNLGFDEDTNELYITDEAPPSISISASSPYLLSGETTDLIVTLYDGVGAPLANKSVTISDGTSVYSGITNLDGVYTVYNVSVSQDTTFTATYSSVSATCKVEYCSFVDYGVTNNSKLDYWYWNKNYGTGSVSDDGTTFNVTTTSYMTISATLTSPATSSSYIYDFPLTVEFDIVSYEDPTGVTSNSRIRLYNGANNKLAYWDIKDFGVGHYKIVCTEGSQKLYYNGVEQSGSFTFTPTTAWNVAFQTKGNIKFRNFRIREG